jgi:hypothetical protein
LTPPASQGSFEQIRKHVLDDAIDLIRLAGLAVPMVDTSPKRQKNKLLEPVKSWNSTDLMATAGKTKAEYDATPYDARPSEILVDIIGLGAGVYDRCKELGLPVRGVNVGEGAASRDICARLRDELWFKGRDWFQDRACSMPKADCRAHCTNLLVHINGKDGG